MNNCANMEAIKIFKGDDTDFNYGRLVTFKFTGEIDLSGFTGMFELGRFKSVQNLKDASMTVNIPRYFTAQFPLGPMCGTFRLIDTQGRFGTVSNTIAFFVTETPFTPEPATVPLEVPADYPVEINLEIGFQNGDYEVLANKPYYPDGTPIVGEFDIDKAGASSAGAVVALREDLAAEVTARETADTALQNAISAEETARQNADLTLSGRLSTIDELIPTQAGVNNQLADKGFVNSSVQTNTAHYRGLWPTFASVPTEASQYPADEFGVHEPGPNDYMVVQADETRDGGTWRYKYTGSWAINGKAGWEVEYEVNETPLTAAQLAALNSNITAALVSQIGTNQSDIADLSSSKQDTISDLAAIRSGAQAGSTALQPSAAAATYVALSQKAAAGGVASLDNAGKITDGQIPYATSSKVGGIKQSFDATTGTWTVITEDA